MSGVRTAGRHSISGLAVKELQTKGLKNPSRKRPALAAKGCCGELPRQTVFITATGGTGVRKQTNGQQRKQSCTGITPDRVRGVSRENPLPRQRVVLPTPEFLVRASS